MAFKRSSVRFRSAPPVLHDLRNFSKKNRDTGCPCFLGVIVNIASVQTWVRIDLFAGRRRFAAIRIAQNLQRSLLDLPNAFSRHGKHLTELFQRVIAFFLNAETLPEDSFLAWRQNGQRFSHFSAQDALQRLILRQRLYAVFDEIAEFIPVFPDRRL
jgi:hypothetical protein